MVLMLAILLPITGIGSVAKSFVNWDFFNLKASRSTSADRFAEEAAMRKFLARLEMKGGRLFWFAGPVGFRDELMKCLPAWSAAGKNADGVPFPSIAYYERFILKAANVNQIDPALIKAVIWRESKFNHAALGKKGEVGLMQLLPGTKSAAADWAEAHSLRLPSREELLNPELNIMIGSWYLARALRRYRDCKDAAALALCEYNAGPSRAEDWIPDPETPDETVFDLITIPSTRRYVLDILKQYEYYKNEPNPERNLL